MRLIAASPMIAGNQRAPAEADARARPDLSGRWVEAFFLIQMLCQVLLLVPGLAPARMFIRVAAFGVSLAFLLAFAPRHRRHPAFWPAAAAVVLVFLGVLHPNTGSLTAAVGQAALYAAILAPLVWVAGVHVDEHVLRGVMVLLWGFHTLSAAAGAAQVMLPGGPLTPQVSPVIAGQGEDYVESLKITLAGGTSVFRPMGLTDQPGGAATSGFYVVLLALGLWTTERQNPWVRLAYLGSMPLALFCLYLSQMRGMMVMTAVCAAAFIAVLAFKGDGRRAATLGAVLATMIALSLAWAISVGGQSVTNRLASLVADDPSQVYYANRGHFLQRTITDLLPRFPLGAGMGRWGMMHYYFGDKTAPAERGEIWAEIQWTGWLLDGGVPLVLLYCAAIAAAFWVAGRVAMRCGGVLGVLGAMVFAYDLGALAMTFNYPLFIGQSGLEFWIINACLYAAWVGRARVTKMIVVERIVERVSRQRAKPALPGLVGAPTEGVHQ